MTDPLEEKPLHVLFLEAVAAKYTKVCGMEVRLKEVSPKGASLSIDDVGVNYLASLKLIDDLRKVFTSHSATITAFAPNGETRFPTQGEAIVTLTGLNAEHLDNEVKRFLLPKMSRQILEREVLHHSMSLQRELTEQFVTPSVS